ncbi:MAG: hypothetical protein KC776_12450 [Myxococcales bacterium]|nr:hypothetical protein [Myxococcales bacterium]
MSRIVVLLWLGTAGTRAAAQPDLDAWAQARWIRLSDPAPSSATLQHYDPKLVASIEGLLDQARIAATSLDSDTALARAGEAKAMLVAHPELPQAGWLMAERHLVEASIRGGVEGGAAEAERLTRAALVLEGPRARAVGEDRAPAQLAAPTTVAVRGLAADDVLYWDETRATPPLSTPPGEHHARVLRRGELVWAGWVAVKPAARAIALPVPSAVACSRDDLAGVRIAKGRVQAPASVRCSEWAVAVPRRGGGVSVASCTAASCGPLLAWRSGDGVVYSGPPQPRTEKPFPTWVAVGAGLGAAMVTTVVLWRAGVFEGSEPGRSRWEYVGPQSSSAALRF